MIALALVLLAVLAIPILWVLYMAVMNLSGICQASTLPTTALRMCYPLLAIGYGWDFLCNVPVVTVIFRGAAPVHRQPAPAAVCRRHRGLAPDAGQLVCGQPAEPVQPRWAAHQDLTAHASPQPLLAGFYCQQGIAFH